MLYQRITKYYYDKLLAKDMNVAYNKAIILPVSADWTAKIKTLTRPYKTLSKLTNLLWKI